MRAAPFMATAHTSLPSALYLPMKALVATFESMAVPKAMSVLKEPATYVFPSLDTATGAERTALSASEKASTFFVHLTVPNDAACNVHAMKARLKLSRIFFILYFSLI